MVKNVDRFVGVDIYENYYYLQSGALHKSNLRNDYLNLKYGTPDIIDISNPLQILLFYKNFNKAILLDNQLSFITEIELPIGSELIANASKNKIWIYNQIHMVLGLYNLTTKKNEITSIPFSTPIVNLSGNLNQAFAINNKNQLLVFNYLARKVKTIDLQRTLQPVSLLPPYTIKDNILYKLNKEVFKTVEDIESFEVTNSKLYFFKENDIYMSPIPKN